MEGVLELDYLSFQPKLLYLYCMNLYLFIYFKHKCVQVLERIVTGTVESLCLKVLRTQIECTEQRRIIRLALSRGLVWTVLRGHFPTQLFYHHLVVWYHHLKDQFANGKIPQNNYWGTLVFQIAQLQIRQILCYVLINYITVSILITKKQIPWLKMVKFYFRKLNQPVSLRRYITHIQGIRFLFCLIININVSIAWAQIPIQLPSDLRKYL